MGKDWKNLRHNRGSLGCRKQIFSENMDIKGTPGESMDEREKCLYRFTE